MRNILSLYNQSIDGKEINEWIKYHTDNHTEYTRIAKYFKKHYVIKNYGSYTICFNTPGAGKYEINKYPTIFRNK